MMMIRTGTVGGIIVAMSMKRKQDGHGHERVNDTHHDCVDPASNKARDRAVQGTDRGRDNAGEEADDDRGLSALHEAAELVVSDHIGAQRMLG